MVFKTHPDEARYGKQRSSHPRVRVTKCYIIYFLYDVKQLPLLDAFRTLNWVDLRIEMGKMGLI